MRRNGQTRRVETWCGGPRCPCGLYGFGCRREVAWFRAAVELTYKDTAGKPGIELLFREKEPSLEIVEAGRPWSFDGDGGLSRLVSEAHRINLAYLFDPVLAIHTSLVDPVAELPDMDVRGGL